MMPILRSWASMALLAVPFADPFLIGMVDNPEAEAIRARQNGYLGSPSAALSASRSWNFFGPVKRSRTTSRVHRSPRNSSDLATGHDCRYCFGTLQV